MTKKQHSFYYGWVIVAVSALCLFFNSPGQTFSVSIFIDYYIQEFGWSRSQISSFYSIATLVSGLSMPFVGNLIDKKGHRTSIGIVAFLFGLTLIWMSQVNAPWMILIGFLFIRMFGQGAMSLIPSVLIPQWFDKKKGRAFSFVTIGAVLGSATFPPLNHFLIQSRGLTFAWLFWAVALLFIMLPIGLIFVKNRPEDMGQVIDGQLSVSIEDEKDNKLSDAIHPPDVSWTLQEAKQTRSFWLMLFVSIVPSLVNTAFTFHMVSIISEKGHDAALAAYLLSTIAVTQMIMTFAAGYVLEKVKVNIVKSLNFVLYFGILLLLNFSEQPALLFVFAVLQGSFVAFDSVSTNVLWPDYFGRVHLGKIRGLAMSAMVIGSALGPLPFGIAYDIFGGYHEVLLLVLILPALASVACFLSPAPTREHLSD
ncbi:MFS transporter [Marinilactibacillus kalidii]|uniref:MFS transporter n=1 Tax=Marinilactibacillus kalidii TaxID=2820274 RepID=UPI001ABE1C69|nr:MFS transporter [Marinilactibacillus kalidii]